MLEAVCAAARPRHKTKVLDKASQFTGSLHRSIFLQSNFIQNVVTLLEINMPGSLPCKEMASDIFAATHTVHLLKKRKKKHMQKQKNKNKTKLEKASSTTTEYSISWAYR